MDENNIANALWVEKYRPKKLDDVVLEPHQKKFVSECMMKEEIPNLLFVGPPGSGKTTTARIIVDKLIKDESDILELNGSSATGIDTFREVIEPYLKCPPYLSNHKIVFIDEFDYMTQNAQAGMRHIMEKYHVTGRFICTANYSSKILKPLHSRFQTFEMKTISKEFAIKYCEDILQAEKVEFDSSTVELIVQSLLPDIRKVVNTLQRNVSDGKLQGVDKNQITSIEQKLIGEITKILDSIGKAEMNTVINSTIPEIMNILSQGEPDYYTIYEKLFSGKTKPWAKIVVNRYNNNHSGAAVPQMHFIAMVWDAIYAGMEYWKTFKR